MSSRASQWPCPQPPTIADKVAVGEKRNASRGQKTDRARREVQERELHDAPRRQKPPPLGTRPASFAEPRGEVERVQRHIVDQMVDAPLLPTFDVLVPQMVDQLLLDVLSPFDSHVPKQVIEVPQVFLDDIHVRTSVGVPQQVAEQLVTVLTFLKQTVDNRIPHGGGRRLQGLLPGQNSTASGAAQTVDIPSPGGGLQDLRPGQGSTASSSHSLGAADEAFTGFFSHFSPWEKVRRSPGARKRGCMHGRWRLMRTWRPRTSRRLSWRRKRST